jgi:hypothetical protein
MQRSSACVTSSAAWSRWLIHQTALAVVAAQAPGAGTAPIGRIRSTGLPIIAVSKPTLTEVQAERRQRGKRGFHASKHTMFAADFQLSRSGDCWGDS